MQHELVKSVLLFVDEITRFRLGVFDGSISMGISRYDKKCIQTYTVYYFHNFCNRLSIIGCELTDGGAAAMASALVKQQYITVLIVKRL